MLVVALSITCLAGYQLSCRLSDQRKPGGMKAVVTLSSHAAQMGPGSAVARQLDVPVTPFDKLQFPLKVSKTALNQGALLLTPQCPRLPKAPNPAAVPRDAFLPTNKGRRGCS